MSFRIVRNYSNARDGVHRRIIKRGLTLEEAQAHCKNPETSSRTATNRHARRTSQRAGCEWFDGYEEAK